MKKTKIINVLKAYSMKLQNEHNNYTKVQKPHTKSLKKDDRAIKARDNLKRPYLKEDRNNEVF